MFLKSKFLNLGNDFQVTPKYECWCGHFTYMVNVPYQWSEQKARQSRLTKAKFRNHEEWRRKIGDLEALESKVIINFRVFFLKANFRVYYGIVFTYFITYTQTYMRTEEQ